MSIKLFRPVQGDKDIGWRLTQPFGTRPEVYGKMGFKGHMGIDYAGPRPGDIIPIFAAIGGKCDVFDDGDAGYGKHIKIKTVIDGKEYQVLYGHLSQVFVKNGEVVDALHKIGMMGTTGFSSGVHLHFEIKDPTIMNNGYKGRFDPASYIVDWPSVLPSIENPFETDYLALLPKIEAEAGIKTFFQRFDGTPLENQTKAMMAIGLIRLEQKLTKK